MICYLAHVVPMKNQCFLSITMHNLSLVWCICLLSRAYSLPLEIDGWSCRNSVLPESARMSLYCVFTYDLMLVLESLARPAAVSLQFPINNKAGGWFSSWTRKSDWKKPYVFDFALSFCTFWSVYEDRSKERDVSSKSFDAHEPPRVQIWSVYEDRIRKWRF